MPRFRKDYAVGKDLETDPLQENGPRPRWRLRTMDPAPDLDRTPPPDLRPALAISSPNKRRRALMDQALEYMRNGHPLFEFSRLDKAPSLAELTRWFTAEDARDEYRQAEECCANVLHGQILEIASTVTDPARAKVMIDARMKLVEKLHPKKYAKDSAGTAAAAPALVINVKHYTDVAPHVPLEEMLR